MKCEEAREFASALCDGETIPRTAAEHIGQCEACRKRLKEFAEIGAELRRVASLVSKEGTIIPAWKKVERAVPSWWSKGRESMRLPRFVFALLMVAIVALGSGVVILRTRAQGQNQKATLFLTAALPGGQGVPCTLTLDDSRMSKCAAVAPGLAIEFRTITRDGDRIKLGVRVKAYNWTAAKKGSVVNLDSSLDGVEEHSYWFEPGEELKIPLADSGTDVTITGTLLDHTAALINMAPGESLDPKPDELRFVSPVLVQGKEIVCDFEGASSTAHGRAQGIEMYVPNEGLYHVALLPLRGAVEGKVEGSRVSFELEGSPYKFLLAAPVTRNEHVWILLDRDFKPSGEVAQHGYIGVRDESLLLINP